jgi:hypothetical protein
MKLLTSKWMTNDFFLENLDMVDGKAGLSGIVGL